MRKIAVLSVVALLILLAYFGSRDEGEGEGEGETSSIVDNAELALTRAGFIEISVSDEDGVVILAGTVETESEQFAVGRVARSVADVVDIDNRVTAAEAKPDETPAGAATAPALELQGELSGLVARDPIVFGSGNAELAVESTVVLDEVVRLLAEYPGITVEVAGHTDADGEEAENQRLSVERADAVLDYVTAQGADGALLSSAGYGESQPVADNETGEGKKLNRRIVFQVIS